MRPVSLKHLLALTLLASTPASAQNLDLLCKAHDGQPLGVKGGKTVPITCDTIHAMAAWFPVPDLGRGFVTALHTLSTAKFTNFYNDPKQAALRLICAPNLQGYLCTFPLGPAELIVGADGVVRAISKTVSKDGPDFSAVMQKSAQELGVDSLSPGAVDLAMDIEAEAMREGAGRNVDVTKTPRSYIYLFHT